MTVHQLQNPNSTAEPVSPGVRYAIDRLNRITSMQFVTSQTSRQWQFGGSEIETTATPALSVYSGGAVIITSPPNERLSELRGALEFGKLPDFSIASLDLARQALNRLDARVKEDIEQWAARLASDISRAND